MKSKTVKWLIGIGVVILIAGIGINRYKKWQSDSMGYSAPAIETIESILATSTTEGVPGVVLIPVDTNGFEFVNKYFDLGMVYIFNKDQKVVDSNILSFGGTCYTDIITSVCKGFTTTSDPEKLKESDKIPLLDSLLASTFPLTQAGFENLDQYDYIIAYGWAKFMKASYKPQPVELAACVEQHRQQGLKILILAVNNDFVSNWYHDEEAPELIGL